MTCPLCKSPESLSEVVNMKEYDDEAWKDYGWRQCSTCRVIYRSPMPTEEHLRQYYETSYRKPEYPTLHDRAVQIVRAERIITYMKSQGIETVERALDFGCANGTLLEELRGEYGCEVFGVEMNPRDRQIAKESRHIEVSHTIEDAGSYYDLVVLAHVLEHLPAPVEFLADLKNRVLPGGRIVFEMPHPNSTGAWMEAHVTVWMPEVFGTVLAYAGWEHLDTTQNAPGLFHAMGRRP